MTLAQMVKDPLAMQETQVLSLGWEDPLCYAMLSRFSRVRLCVTPYAGDLRELLRVPLRSQAYCGFGTGLSGLHWFCGNGKGPHLE